MTAIEIKTNIANALNVNECIIKCRYCKYWGFNRGKVMNSMGESRCQIRKKDNMVGACQFCRKFTPIEKKY